MLSCGHDLSLFSHELTESVTERVFAVRAFVPFLLFACRCSLSELKALIHSEAELK